VDVPETNLAARVTVDDRERPSGLAARLAELWSPVFEGRLGLGDIEIGSRVVVERKTVADFAASIADGRLFRQATALSRRVSRPLLIVEGEDSIDVAAHNPRALRGLLLSLAAGCRLPLLRTASIEETAEMIAQLAAQESRRAARMRRHDATSRAAPKVSLDVLGAIPGVGDRRTRQLVDRFGSMRAVFAATQEDLEATPGIGAGIAKSIRHAGDAGPQRPPQEG
jgi:ERCC4-type nuclease